MAKEYALDIKQVLSAVDTQKLDYHSLLTEQERKAYSPFVIMRYLSSLANNSALQSYAILAVNDLVNIGFSDLKDHAELQHLLLCCAGAGSRQFHPWIPVPRGKKRRDNPILELIQNYYPQLNSQELAIMLATITGQQITDLAVASGYNENKIQELVKIHSAK
tara:strand:+ start:472 stop:960 length:489 start_codon:yes stop_codon:yes gene_type:complete